MEAISFGLVGATGLVGQTVLDLLQEGILEKEIKELKLYASQESVGKVIQVQQRRVTIEKPSFESLRSCHVVLFAAGHKLARELIPSLSQKGVLCIDKSPAFRMHPDVPLVVPEVNAYRLHLPRFPSFPVVTSPNCCAIPLSMVLKAIHTEFDLQRVVVSTYQSMSGAGQAGLDALVTESQKFFASQDLTCQESETFYSSPAFNAIPFIDNVLESGQTSEEEKIASEVRRLLDLPELPISVTSVRVPTFVGHGQSVTIECAKPFTVEQMQEAVQNFPGVILSDKHLTPRDVQGKNTVSVGRIRRSEAFSNGASFWIVNDNLRKGAALNGLQIFEYCDRANIFSQLKPHRQGR